VIRVEFLEGALGPGCSAWAEPGALLMDVSDEARAPIGFSCRSASCGTCRVEILEGEHLLAAPSIEERSALALAGAQPARRLACRARIGEGEGRVRLRWVGDAP
jgi:ferredoxin